MKELTSLTQSVADLWAFLWPRFTLLLLASAATWFVARSSVRRVIERSSRIDPNGIRRTRNFLKIYGLTALIPVAASFTLLFALFATTETLWLVGDTVPPRIAYMPDAKL